MPSWSGRRRCAKGWWKLPKYPKGLKGEEIPLEARIFAVADVYDALLSPRPYKQPWTPEEAQEELRAQAGRGLDPKLVAVFLDPIQQTTPR